MEEHLEIPSHRIVLSAESIFKILVMLSITQHNGAVKYTKCLCVLLTAPKIQLTRQKNILSCGTFNCP
jgi:hypothetical protein